MRRRQRLGVIYLHGPSESLTLSVHISAYTGYMIIAWTAIKNLISLTIGLNFPFSRQLDINYSCVLLHSIVSQIIFAHYQSHMYYLNTDCFSGDKFLFKLFGGFIFSINKRQVFPDCPTNVSWEGYLLLPPPF